MPICLEPKAINIAVSSSIIEKMASDPAAAAKYENVFAEMSGNAERVEKFAQEYNDEILGAGAAIDKNGKVSYWMVGRSKDKMENPGTVYKEKIQKQIVEKRAKRGRGLEGEKTGKGRILRKNDGEDESKADRDGNKSVCEGAGRWKRHADGFIHIAVRRKEELLCG